MEEKVDELEQYSRRNSVRINGVPEAEGESTDKIVKVIGRAFGVDIEDGDIDRSHRVGRSENDEGVKINRAILVKFSSFVHKRRFTKEKKTLKDADLSEVCPASGNQKPKVFLNDDLTRLRSQVAAKARTLKKNRIIQDTWALDGGIFVRLENGNTKRVTTMKGLVELVDK